MDEEWLDLLGGGAATTGGAKTIILEKMLGAAAEEIQIRKENGVVAAGMKGNSFIVG